MINIKIFKETCVLGIDNIIGVRVPVLRRYAKELAKENKIETLLKQIDNEYYEEIMIQGMLIGLEKNNFDVSLNYIEDFIPKIDNWAVCDVFCGGLKITNKYKKEMWEFLQTYIDSDKEFEIRFGIVMILSYYIEKEYIEEIFEVFENITIKAYYVQMAVAWAISVCLIKFYDKTVEYLQDATSLDKFTYNKAIQKAIESYRIDDKQKDFLRKMKRI